ncbi:hypothetical protein BJH93_11080 [Kocuria polaris]|nr:hypothetical protein [Kocuria polaris]
MSKTLNRLGAMLVSAFLASGLALAAPAAAAPAGDTEPPPGVQTETQYVQADSQEEAERLLDQLEAEQQGVSSDGGSEGVPQPALRAGSKVKYGPCTLHSDGVYLRASSGYQNVGFKSYTKCSTKVTSISHKNTLRQKNLINWKLVSPTEGGSNKNYGATALSSKSINYSCPKKGKHWWSGSTLGTMIYKGETYYARSYAPVSKVKLACSS